MSTIQARKKEATPPTYNFIEPTQETPKKILGFSGKLDSGKSSSCNFLTALAFTHLLQLTPYAFVSPEGQLVVQAEEDTLKVVNLRDHSPEAKDWLDKFVHPFIKIFSTAEPLKNHIVEFFGIDEKLVWGSQEDKNQTTHLRWENMPDKPKGKSGFMTVRDCLEFLGTNILRKIDNDCHVKALVKSITSSSTAYCLVDDVRFPNEVEALQKIGAKVIRLTKTTEEAAANMHISNTALDNYKNFDYILDNQDISMDESFGLLMARLIEWGYFEVVE